MCGNQRGKRRWENRERSSVSAAADGAGKGEALVADDDGDDAVR